MAPPRCLWALQAQPGGTQGRPRVGGGKHPNDLQPFRWINTLLVTP